MNQALQTMIARYPRGSSEESVNALREILQELTLLGLWRGKFFERAALYGGTALRVLYGLDRFSEDMDFSLLQADRSFRLERYLPYVCKELASWGFQVLVEPRIKSPGSAIESAFLKADTREHLLEIEAGETLAAAVPAGHRLRIKVEVDTDPPPAFATEVKFCLMPIPFSVLAYAPPSLFAGKMHELLCRSWKNRVKGRDWYDFVWYVARGVPLNLGHLEARMRQSGHLQGPEPLSPATVSTLLLERIATIDVEQARLDVVRYLSDPVAVAVWSREFFADIAGRIRAE